jgi:alanine-glyoxylate transaminase/serine-glyoxylate transaminase/serine-pyruvate transaminase
MQDSATSFQPPKRLLMGPGPSPVAPRVYAAMQKHIVGHLDPYFFQICSEIRNELRTVYGTANEFTFAVSGTGSAGMEACISNFVTEGSKFAVFANGFFCDRVTEMGWRQRAQVVRFEKPWGENFDDNEARDFIKREKPKVVAYVTAETSTGVVQPGKGICEAAHQVGALVIADCVTSLGTMPVNIDQTGIDIAFSCSQKGLGAPPGLSPVTVSPLALDQLRLREKPKETFYLDLNLLNDYFNGSHKYHHTSPISLFFALREALAIVSEEGLKPRFERHRRNHLAFSAGLEAMGLELQVAEGKRLWALNTPKVPAGIDDAKVRKRLLEGDGIEILGGFGQLAGKVFRIGTMGHGSRKENVLLLLDRFEAALKAEGFAVKANGVAAAEEVYSREFASA